MSSNAKSSNLESSIAHLNTVDNKEVDKFRTPPTNHLYTRTSYIVISCNTTHYSISFRYHLNCQLSNDVIVNFFRLIKKFELH